MIRSLSSTSAVLLVLFASSAVAEKVTVAGFVTNAGSPAEYRINEIPVHCVAGETITLSFEGSKKKKERVCPQHVFGESITVSGMKDRAGLIIATLVERANPVDLKVKGDAIIDKVLQPFANGTVLVRADGYPLLIDAKTKWDFVDEDGRTFGLADIAPNVWISYKGVLHPDGKLSVQQAGLEHNVVGDSEDWLRKNKEFNAADVKEGDRQTAVGKKILGINAKRVPAYKDDAMQARINSVGGRLIPAYQRELPDSNPTKIVFRFQLVDEPKLFGCLDSPSGIIQVPYQVVQALPDDGQLAEVLAASVADVLQKQTLRTQGTRNLLKVTQLAGTIAGALMLNPGVAMPYLLPDSQLSSSLDRQIVEVSTRSSLDLMNDAGFKLKSAPSAWWVLAAKQKNRSLQQTDIPYASQCLYLWLSVAWTKTTASEGG